MTKSTLLLLHYKQHNVKMNVLVPHYMKTESIKMMVHLRPNSEISDSLIAKKQGNRPRWLTRHTSSEIYLAGFEEQTRTNLMRKKFQAA